MGLEIINELKKKKKLTNEQLSELSGVPIGTLAKLTSGITKDPKLDTLKALARVLECSLEDFDDYVPNKNNFFLYENEKIIIKDYRGLSETGKNTVSNVIDNLLVFERKITEEAKQNNNINLPIRNVNIPEIKTIEPINDENNEEDLVSIPLSEQKASAGTGFYLGDEYMVDTKVVLNDLTRRADFAVPVDGHSMEPKYSDGDIILVRQQPDIDLGEIGLYIVDGNGYVKCKGRDRLISLNKDYPDIPLSEFNEIKCCGKVVGKLEKNWIKE